mgnify:CR=1 FL=1
MCIESDQALAALPPPAPPSALVSGAPAVCSLHALSRRAGRQAGFRHFSAYWRAPLARASWPMARASRAGTWRRRAARTPTSAAPRCARPSWRAAAVGADAHAVTALVLVARSAEGGVGEPRAERAHARRFERQGQARTDSMPVTGFPTPCAPGALPGTQGAASVAASSARRVGAARPGATARAFLWRQP